MKLGVPEDAAAGMGPLLRKAHQAKLIESSSAYLWRKSKDTEFLKVSLRNGSSETLYYKDFVSGALLKSGVDRAKDFAIQRAIDEKREDVGVKREDLEQAIDAEYGENEIFPKSDVVDDWLKLIDYDAENVASVRPVTSHRGEEFLRKNIL